MRVEFSVKIETLTLKLDYIFNEEKDMMRDKVREKGANVRKIKSQESDRGGTGSIGKSRDDNMHVFEMDPYPKHKIEYPFEDLDPIPLDDYDFLDEFGYDESDYYDLDEFGIDDY